jgi:hypothetical protein
MYKPLRDYRAKDSLETGDPNKVIYGDHIQSELEAISDAFADTGIMASVKWDGRNFNYGYNVSSCEPQSSIVRVNLSTPVNSDGGLTAGDFAAVVTPYTIRGRMVIASITDQREAYIDIAFRELDGGSWVVPKFGNAPDNTDQSDPLYGKCQAGFAFILLDQVPETN